MNLPPKQLKDQLAGIAPAGALPDPDDTADSIPDEEFPFASAAIRDKELIKITNDVRVRQHPESLPVLEAFQEFLDRERRRARNRMAILASFLIIVFLVAMGATLLVGKLLINQVRDDFSTVENIVNNIEASQAMTTQKFAQTQAHVSDALTKIADQADALSSLQSELVNRRSSIAATTTEIEQRTAAYDKEFNDVKEILKALEDENSILKEGLERMEDRWATTMTTPVAAQPVPRIKSSRPKSAGPRKRHTLAMLIVPNGTTNPIDWRLPIPE